MKRISLAIILACFAMALTAQDVIRVKHKGAKPTITDFAWAFCQAADQDEEVGDRPSNAVYDALKRYRKGLPQDENDILTVDEKNGYILYVSESQPTVYFKLEMCYWNEADGKHKLFAFNNMATLLDGKPACTETSGLLFYRYNNATGKMTYCDPPGFTVDYSNTTYSLPRKGKNITVTKWNDDGTKENKTLKWNGRSFSF